MKQTYFILFFVLLLLSCKDQYYELDKDPLMGKINGEEWVFGSGRVSFDPFSNQGLRGIMLQETLNDPCARVLSVEPHLSILIPAGVGNYNLNTGDIYYVKFSVDGVTEYTASSGFIQIVGSTQTQLIGFLSANFDDGNNAQGSFSLRLCD